MSIVHLAVLLAVISGLAGNTPYHMLFYSVLAIAVVWLIIKSQARLLLKTRRLLRQKESTLSELESRRTELEAKNRRITESLVYAQRIQAALLPSVAYFRKLFSRSFIYFKPRDIVSGDFYWLSERSGRVFIVAADCTGHGVPGALMSMIGHDLLEKIINTDNITEPAKILDRINRELWETFSREKGTIPVIKDSMDMGICMVDRSKKRIEYAGAFFPLFLIRDNRLIEVKGDKFVLGTEPSGSHYANNVIDLQEDDICYLFSDGYVDQFGGEDNKKFMYRRFRYLLLTIHNFPLDDQGSILEENMRTWMGDNPQVDDILIIGFRPL